jgi:hypothetical protein
MVKWECWGKYMAVYWKCGIGVRGVRVVDLLAEAGVSTRYLSPLFSKVKRSISLLLASAGLIIVLHVVKASMPMLISSEVKVSVFAAS